jgi:hypothetical protein
MARVALQHLSPPIPGHMRKALAPTKVKDHPSNRIADMTRFLAALAIALTAFYMPTTASAAELVYVEWKSCGICLQFNRQMARKYATSETGRKIPLRRVDILRRWPADLKRVNRPVYTPVFILVEKGREVGRFAGYGSPQQFNRDLQRLLQRR